jgi:hypothetical protein
MISRVLLSTAFLVLGAPAFGGGALPAPGSETEAQLLARIQVERNPVKESLLETRLAGLELDQAIQAYDQGNLEQGEMLLKVFLGRINDSWRMLRISGQNATRNSRGFKELDIALRTDARRLGDLERSLPYHDREPIEKAGKEVERVRTEVLGELFPRSQMTAPAKPPAKTD